MPPIYLTDLIAVGLVGLAVIVMAIVWITNRKPPVNPYKNLSTYDSIDALMHRSSEEGKALLISMGEGFSGQNSSLGDSVGVLIEQILLSRSVFNDQPTHSFNGDSALACISQLVLHGAYENAVASELFRSEHTALSGVSGFGWMAGMLPELARKGNGGMILTGTMRPEHILIADLAERKDVPLVAATGSLAAQAAFFVSGSEVTLGEDYYLPSIGKVNQPAYQNQAKTMNWIRGILVIGLIVAALLKLSGVLP